MTGHREDMEIGAVPVRLLVCSDRHLRGMSMHRAVRQDEFHVRAARAALLPGLELEGSEVGDEVRFPHMPSRTHRDEIALAAEEARAALTLREFAGVFEDEGLVAKKVEKQRQIGRHGKARALPAAAVEMAIARIERQGEEALRTPFETVGPTVARLDRRAAVAREHVDDLLVEMPLRRGLGASGEVDDEDGDEIAASLDVDDSALGP